MTCTCKRPCPMNCRCSCHDPSTPERGACAEAPSFGWSLDFHSSRNDVSDVVGAQLGAAGRLNQAGPQRVNARPLIDHPKEMTDMNDSKFERLKRLHEQGFELTYEEQGQLIDYADETEDWIKAPDQSLMGREIL